MIFHRNFKDLTRTHLKNAFWLNIFVGASFQILDNQQVACGLKLGPAAILNQNPIFKIGSINNRKIENELMSCLPEKPWPKRLRASIYIWTDALFLNRTLDYSDICSSRTFWPLLYIKGNFVAFIEGFKTGCVDC